MNSFQGISKKRELLQRDITKSTKETSNSVQQMEKTEQEGLDTEERINKTVEQCFVNQLFRDEMGKNSNKNSENDWHFKKKMYLCIG